MENIYYIENWFLSTTTLVIVSDLRGCKNDQPVISSKPHFLQGDPSLLKWVEQIDSGHILKQCSHLLTWNLSDLVVRWFFYFGTEQRDWQLKHPVNTLYIFVLFIKGQSAQRTWSNSSFHSKSQAHRTRSVEGLNPDPALHDTLVQMEPRTGRSLAGQIRMQVFDSS